MPMLVAMSASGDVLVTTDGSVARLHLPALAGGVEVLGEVDLDVYVARAGLDRVDHEFESWTDLGAWVNQRVEGWLPHHRLDPADWDVEDVGDMLETFDDLVSRGENDEARALIDWLLGVPVVRARGDLFDRVLERQRGASRPAVLPPRFKTDQAPEIVERAKQRWAVAA